MDKLNLEDNIESLFRWFSESFELEIYEPEDFGLFIREIENIDFNIEENKKILKVFSFQIFLFHNFFSNNKVLLEPDSRYKFLLFAEVVEAKSMEYYIELKMPNLTF